MKLDEGTMVKALARADAAAGEADAIAAQISSGQYKEALSRCARAYSGPVGRLCMALTGSQAERGLVQETLIAAYDAFPSFRNEGSVRSWLYGIARRICGRHNEMKNRRQARLRLVHDTGRGVDAGELALERERAIRARNALASLKPSEREAVVLRYDAGPASARSRSRAAWTKPPRASASRGRWCASGSRSPMFNSSLFRGSLAGDAS